MMMNIVEELIQVLKTKRLERGDSPQQAEIYALNYMRGFLETSCLMNPQLGKDVAWHVNHIKQSG